MGGTIAGSIDVHSGSKKITFDFREVKTSNMGGSPRGIEIRAAGSPHGFVKFYPVDPNPHGNAHYNRDQESFYKAAARALAGNIQVEEAEETFTRLTIGDRPPTTDDKSWRKLSREQQKARTSEYNKDEQKKLDDKNLSAFHKDVDGKLRKRHRSTCKWEGVTYTLP